MLTPIRVIRPFILTVSSALAVGIYLYVTSTIHATDLQRIRIVQLYAFSAVTCLYFALLISPLYSVFQNFPLRPLFVKARRAIGVSALLFGLLHATFAFFGLLGGFSGLFFLSARYLLTVSLGFVALIILSLMGLTSFDFMIVRMGRNWKRLHRFIYVAAVLVLFHALLLGTHFADLSKAIPKIFFSAAFFLFFLEAIRFDRFVAYKRPTVPRFGLPFVACFTLLMVGAYYFLLPSATTKSIGIHAQHIQLAQQAQQQSTQGQQNIPGLDGDRNKRYTVNFTIPPSIKPNEATTLSFTVYDAANGTPVTIFKQLQEKVAHLIIVDSELNFFDHVHPTQVGSSFTIPYTFPKEGVYHLYVDFQPLGGIEQQIGVTIPVGSVGEVGKSTQPPDTNLAKTFGNYQVTLQNKGPLNAQAMSVGQQTITFQIANAQTKAPITDLQPYLGAFGHLVMINEQTYDYLHVHPTRLQPPKPGETGGPNVDFLPIGIYGPFKPGTYRAWAQFQHNGTVFTADFTVAIQ